MARAGRRRRFVRHEPVCRDWCSRATVDRGPGRRERASQAAPPGAKNDDRGERTRGLTIRPLTGSGNRPASLFMNTLRFRMAAVGVLSGGRMSASDITLADRASQRVLTKLPTDSPPQYSPGITWPLRSMTWHFALILSPRGCRERPALTMPHRTEAWRSCAGAWACRSLRRCLNRRRNCTVRRLLRDSRMASAPAGIS